MSETVWGKIYKHLKSKGIDVYSPGTKDGECKSKYVVAKNSNVAAHTSFSTNNAYYDVMVYVPKNAYSKLEPYVAEVKNALKELNFIKEAGVETDSYYDDKIKAHMVSISYLNYRKK